MIRKIKPELLLAENVRTLLYRRHVSASALAIWCGHGDSWISKVINCGRGVQLKDLGKIADFLGLTVAQLFQHGISEIAERRKHERRTPGSDRRTGTDRRQPMEGRLHPEMRKFPPRRIFNEDGTVRPMRLKHGATRKQLPSSGTSHGRHG